MPEEQEIVWADPPGTRGRTDLSSIWLDRLAPFVEHQGEWGKVWTFESNSGASNTATRLRQRKVAYAPGKWEFTVRKSDLYARYVGPEED